MIWEKMNCTSQSIDKRTSLHGQDVTSMVSTIYSNSTSSTAYSIHVTIHVFDILKDYSLNDYEKVEIFHANP
jgi:hypothetical protein